MLNEKVYCGEVVWFSPQKGFGFLRWSIDGVSQKDMFCHYSNIASDGFKTLYKDQKVEFKIGTNKHGDPKAIDVVALTH